MCAHSLSALSDAEVITNVLAFKHGDVLFPISFRMGKLTNMHSLTSLLCNGQQCNNQLSTVKVTIFHYTSRTMDAPNAKRQRVLTPNNQPALTAPALRALKSMREGLTPLEHARANQIKESSAWTYYCLAAASLEYNELMAITRPLIPDDAWKLLSALKGSCIFMGPLKDIIERADNTLDKDGAYHTHEHKISTLRLARLILQKE